MSCLYVHLATAVFLHLAKTYATVMSDDRGALSLLAQALSPWQQGLSSKCHWRRESTIVHFDGSLFFHRQSDIIHH